MPLNRASWPSDLIGLGLQLSTFLLSVFDNARAIWNRALVSAKRLKLQ
jgi:hypothetical protein